MQKFDAVAQQFPEGGLVADGPALFRRTGAFLSRLSDRGLALAIGGVLFVLTAWPLLLVEVPPLQDLPNHLAAVTVITHPERYPEFVSNGFWKTNAALFTWLVFVGKVVGPKVAAKLFTLLVLAANAVVLPQFVVRFGGRRRLLVASLFMWPMIHNWFVSMGMLDFALGVPFALVMLMLLDTQRQRPTRARFALIVVASLCTWYAHVFAVMVLSMLTAVEIVVRGPRSLSRESVRERLDVARRVLLPLVPAMLLTAFSVYRHVTEPVGEMTGFVDMGRLIPTWELFYNLWAEWMWSFTKLEISTIVPTVLLGLWAIYTWRKESPTYFSPLAYGLLAALFAFSPYIATNWFNVNSRFIPFLWVGALLRLPERLDRRVASLLAVSAGLYSIGMGVDYARLDADRAKFTAGVAAVPTGSRLLPLLFSRKLTSENTRSLLHAWGYYVMEKQTSAPLLFAHSRSFPVMYKEPPPPQFNHLVLESFAPSMGTPTWMCNVLRSGGVFSNDCEGEWRAQWKKFWDQALPEYDHVLMWDPTPEAQAVVPPAYRIAFQQDRLFIYERVQGAQAQTEPLPELDEQTAAAAAATPALTAAERVSER